MPIRIDGGAGVTFPDSVQQTNAVTNTGGSPPYYAARAWVNYNAVGTSRAIRAAVNIASVARPSGPGFYTVTFSTAMPDANYAIVASAGSSGTVLIVSISAPTTTSFDLNVQTLGGVGTDPSYLNVAVFR